MIIDFEFIIEKYKWSFDIIIKNLSVPNFDKQFDTYDKRFDLDFFNKTYNSNFNNYFDGYHFWMSKKKEGYKGFLLVEDNVTYYSQINQDYIVINNLFNKCRNGTFVEFGGCDGVFLSNTYTLEKYFGWNGILIEPITSYFNELKKNRKCKCVQELIYSENDKEIIFGESENRELSGIKDITNIKFKDEKVFKTKTLERILDENKINKEIHFMSVDVEGAEYDILKVFPFNKYKVYCLTIEHGNNKENEEKIKELMLSNGYILYRNILWDNMFILPELLEKKVVNSFDIFDTLIHRHYYNENCIFDMVSKELDDKDFFRKRKTAEFSCDNNISLEIIYDKLDYSKDVMKREFELEKKYLFRNENNLSLVKKDDILISDIFYNYDELKELITHLGINNKLYCSKNGKATGNIYKELLKEYIIVSHTGDNFNSDGMKARENNLNTINDTFGRLTPFEEFLLKNKLGNIVLLLRRVRLSFNYDDNLVTIASLTFLINLIIYKIVLDYCNINNIDNVLLTTRDCCHLYNFFEKLKPDINFKKFYSSRKALIKSSYNFVKYFKTLITGNKNLLLDMNGTGKSIRNFLDNNDIKLDDILYIVKFNAVENINSIFTDNELIDVLEIINYDINGKCIDYIDFPIFEPIEYNTINLVKIHSFINHSVQILLDDKIKNEIINDINKIDNLNNFLKNLCLLFRKSDYFQKIKHIS